MIFGKILKFVASGAKGVFNVQNIPVIGDYVEEIASEDGGKGQFQQINAIRLVRKLARIAIIGISVYFIIKGDDEKAEKLDKQLKKIEYVTE